VEITEWPPVKGSERYRWFNFTLSENYHIDSVLLSQIGNEVRELSFADVPK